MFTMIKSRANWPSPVQNGVTLSYTRAGGLALKGFTLMKSTGRKTEQYCNTPIFVTFCQLQQKGNMVNNN